MCVCVCVIKGVIIDENDAKQYLKYILKEDGVNELLDEGEIKTIPPAIKNPIRKRKIDRGEYFLIVFPTKKTEAKIRPKK